MTSLIALFLGAFLGWLYSMSCYETKLQDARKEKAIAVSSAAKLAELNAQLERDNDKLNEDVDHLHRINANITFKYEQRARMAERFGTIRIHTH